MKKKISGGITALIIITTVAMFNVNINTQKSNLSDISLENVEALASGENSASCYFYCTVSLIYDCTVYFNSLNSMYCSSFRG